EQRPLRVAEVTTLELPAGFVVPDAHGDTWARIRPDRPVPQWPNLSRIKHPVTRVVLWNSIRDQVRSAELDAAIALDVLEAALPDEPDDLITRAILDWGHGVLAGPYSRAGQRTERLHRIAATAATILARTEPGSD